MTQRQRRVYDLRHFRAGAKVAQNRRSVCSWALCLYDGKLLLTSNAIFLKKIYWNIGKGPEGLKFSTFNVTFWPHHAAQTDVKCAKIANFSGLWLSPKWKRAYSTCLELLLGTLPSPQKLHFL